jgi:hypothetical protein
LNCRTMLLEDLFGRQVFRHRGKRFRLRGAGRRSLSLLRDIARNPRCQSKDGLLRLRPRIRAVLSAPAPVALSYVADRTKYTRALRVAIWLLGRIGNAYATPSVLCHVNHADFRVRREAIRALKRLHAWPQLARIQQSHDDARIRALAKVSPPRPYADRLASFVADSKPIEHTEVAHQLVLAPNVEVGDGRPPKSRWQIGRVLRRIRRLVRGARRERSWFSPGHVIGCFSRTHR